ncbi:hypothetical protein L207DRAFT_566745 [Hyaloscypha variabilis F]|uniref:Cell wall proline rich protein n=1 Tax=Hyaloscypha variabilis (strain UAMH 11265 / GT02V1 / F) TaxID=1149755 RepID=A0A2J6RMY5_HYAVF|nr:hypothetical protein L207DRAFT_566745 [Hyaloscypha variabilis F]
MASTSAMSFTAQQISLANGTFRTKADEDISQISPIVSGQVSPQGPAPLPSFVFPSRVPSSPSTSSAPSSYSRATGRRPLSAVEVRAGLNERSSSSHGESSRLPDFSFGMQSPPLSPQSRDTPNRHKRGTSEFIGGDGETGAGQLLSASPTKSQANLPPPPGRRGHAHRRSQALSSHDLSMILKPSQSVQIGGSAPTSPSGNLEYQSQPFPGLQPSNVEPSNMESEITPNEPFKSFKSSRVGFNEVVQIIPRPLSLVSSDSSSTVRGPSHSVSGSISSIISAGSPPSKEPRLRQDARPKTADNQPLRAPESLKRRGSLPLLMESATASVVAPSTPRSARKWTFFGEPKSGESSPRSRPASASSSTKEKKTETAASSPGLASPNTPLPSTEPSSRKSSISRKPSKNKKKVRSWAGSILSRKSRQRGQKKLSRRSPTPPLRVYATMEENEDFDFNQTEQSAPLKPEIQTDFATWKPRKLPPQEEESMSPIIDLDAALGPFNTPSSFGSDWDSSQRGGTRKRAMHSAAGLGGFTGPGMHYHRRAESAPEFENPRFGLHRLGSSSTMADVFEEDEDEEWEDAKASDRDSSTQAAEHEDDTETGLGIDIKVVDSEGMDIGKVMDFEEASFQRGVKRKGSGLSEGERRQMSSTKSVHSATSLMDEPIQEESPSPVEIFDDALPSRPESRAQSSDSTATPPFRPRLGKDLAPVEIQPFSLQPPYPTPTSPRSTTQSSFPSPRSPFSYDTQRISTAPSSITDENGFQSLLMGEPGPELRMSVDGVPSLTSSNSTMTRESGFQQGAPQFRDGQRSASLSSAAVTRKRSSMASLSRLISSSHGERSKLSIESRPESSSGIDKKDKGSKSKRLSRMMRFWKPKESS